MQLNQATDYAFRAVLHLAGSAPGEVVTAQEIARREKVPLRFLLKIMRSLVEAGIVKSVRGVTGGYALARPPGKITLLDVVEAVEGPVRLNRCLIDQEYCTKRWANRCPVHQILEVIQNAVIQELARRNFAELAQKA
ncbi:MAG: Rrf2 family transcriptional regulator [Bacillota bacterium]